MSILVCPICENEMYKCGNQMDLEIKHFVCRKCGSILICNNIQKSQEVHIRTQQGFESFYLEHAERRLKIERRFADTLSSKSAKETYEILGYCEVCGKKSEFLLDFMFSDGVTPNYRERMVCSSCHLNTRQRYIVARVKDNYKNGQMVYMYEQVTAVYEAIKGFARDAVGSEFISENTKGGTIIKGIRHEDAENLSFTNESFDIVVSNDVFEHVNDINKCLLEAYRILKDDGKLIFSIPFQTNKQKTLRRAEIRDGELINLEEGVYHGNPMSKDGSLVFFDFGWDIIPQLLDVGFKDAYMIPYYNEEKGYIGGIPFVFEAIK